MKNPNLFGQLKRNVVFTFPLFYFWLFNFNIGCDTATENNLVCDSNTFVRGYVLSRIGGSPVSGATVNVDQGQNCTAFVTGPDGYYEVAVPAGAYFDLIVNASGRAASRLQSVHPLSQGSVRDGIYLINVEVANSLPVNSPEIGQTYNLIYPPTIDLYGVHDGDNIDFHQYVDIRANLRAANPIADNFEGSDGFRFTIGRPSDPRGSSAVSATPFTSLRFIWTEAYRTYGPENLTFVGIDENHNRVEMQLVVNITGTQDPTQVPAKIDTTQVAVTGMTLGVDLWYMMRAFPDRFRSLGDNAFDPSTYGVSYYVLLFWQKLYTNVTGYKIYSSNNADGPYQEVGRKLQPSWVTSDPCSGNGYGPDIGDRRPNCETRLQSSDRSNYFQPGKTFWYIIKPFNDFGFGPASDPKPVYILPKYDIWLQSPGSNGVPVDPNGKVNNAVLPVVDTLQPNFKWQASACEGADERDDYLFIVPFTGFDHYGYWGDFFPIHEPNTVYEYNPNRASPRNPAVYIFDPVNNLQMSENYGTATDGDAWLTANAYGQITTPNGTIFVRGSAQGLDAGTSYQWAINKSVAKKQLPVTYYSDGNVVSSIVKDGTSLSYSYSNRFLSFGDEHEPVNGPFYFYTSPASNPTDNPVAPTLISCPIPIQSNALSYISQFPGITLPTTNITPLQYRADLVFNTNSCNSVSPSCITSGQFGASNITAAPGGAGPGVGVIWFGGFLFEGQRVINPNLTGYVLQACPVTPSTNNPSNTCTLGWPTTSAQPIYNPSSPPSTIWPYDGVLAAPSLGFYMPAVAVSGAPDYPVRVRVLSVGADGTQGPPSSEQVYRASRALCKQAYFPPPITNLKATLVLSSSIELGWDAINQPANPIFGGYYGITISTSPTQLNYTPIYDRAGLESIPPIYTLIPGGTLLGFTNTNKFVISNANTNSLIQSKTTYYIRVFGLDSNNYPNGDLDNDYETPTYMQNHFNPALWAVFGVAPTGGGLLNPDSSGFQCPYLAADPTCNCSTILPPYSYLRYATSGDPTIDKPLVVTTY